MTWREGMVLNRHLSHWQITIAQYPGGCKWYESLTNHCVAEKREVQASEFPISCSLRTALQAVQ